MALDADRHHRDGWLAQAIAANLTPAEQNVLREAALLLARLSEAERSHR